MTASPLLPDPTRDGLPLVDLHRHLEGSVRPATVGADRATPYALRHSFASLLLHESRSVISVAGQLGHDARLTLSRYGHVIDELEDQPRIDGEEGIRQARAGAAVPSRFPEATDPAVRPMEPRGI